MSGFIFIQTVINAVNVGEPLSDNSCKSWKFLPLYNAQKCSSIFAHLKRFLAFNDINFNELFIDIDVSFMLIYCE